jgi:YHS domain-containing protein
MLKDPVCGLRIRRDRAYARVEHEHVTYYLCCPRCQAEFEAAPAKYAQPQFGETSDHSTAQGANRPHRR